MDILLNPGPVNISDRVRNALLKPDICHREDEFIQLQNSVRQKLLEIYDLDSGWAAILLTGSGTAAVEAMLVSLTGDDSHILILENGVYGERMTKICATYGIRHTIQHHQWEQEIDLQILDNNLSKGFTHVALVQHETTTGRLNNLRQIAELTRKHNIPMLLDAVSSFGVEAINFADWNVAACAATANKCLHGVPGISFSIVQRDKLKSSTQAKSFYLNLATYLNHQDNNGTPFTQSIQVLYALNEALSEHAEQGGWNSRRENYRAKMELLNIRLASLAINPLIDLRESSCVLNTYLLPDNRSYKDLHDYLKQNGFVIYSGQGELASKVFRLSLMGTVTTSDIERLIELLRDFLER